MRKHKWMRIPVLLLLFCLCLPPLPAAAASSPSDWALAEVTEANRDELVPSDLLASYQNYISRQDFCRLMVCLTTACEERSIDRLMGKLGVSRTDSFTDCKNSDVQAACAMGIVQGRGGGIFDPNGSITRQEAAVMLTRTAKLLGLDANTSLSFSDTYNVPSWASEGIRYVSGLTDPVSGNRVMGGVGNNRFDPLGRYTREQAILTALRLYHACLGLTSRNAISTRPSLGVYSGSGDAFVRDTGDRSASVTSVSSGQYLSFLFRVKNHGSSARTMRNVSMKVDGTTVVSWQDFALSPGSWVYYHADSSVMSQFSPGTYRVGLYENGSLLEETYLTLRRNWNLKMPAPSRQTLSSFHPTEQSPYIAYYPAYDGITGFSEFSVDIRADHQPRGTYISGMFFYQDLNSFTNSGSYQNVEGGGGYAGLQSIYDGTRIAIFSMWDIYATDYAGTVHTFRPKALYGGSKDFGGEGTGTQISVPYYWEEGHPYRLLLQQGRNNGHVTVQCWICDLEFGEWTKIGEMDTYLPSSYMKPSAGFLENYLTEYAGEVRTMAVCNMRGLSVDTGQWVSLKKNQFAQNFSHPGSYNFGAEGGEFWMITSGVPGLCSHPSDWTEYNVNRGESSQPY